LDVILDFNLGYMDISGLRTSDDYLSRLRKYVVTMIWQLGPPTFFVTFISVESNWLILLKKLYDLNNKNLGLNIPFDKLETKHVVDFIQCDPITCSWYQNHHMRSIVYEKNSIFGHLLDFFFVTRFQSCGSQHDHGLLWVANAPIYGLDSNNAIGNFVYKYI
jgi:hypothetical protein